MKPSLLQSNDTGRKKAPLPKGRCATAVNAHGGFLRIVTSLTRPVSALHAKAPLPKGAGTAQP